MIHMASLSFEFDTLNEKVIGSANDSLLIRDHNKYIDEMDIFTL